MTENTQRISYDRAYKLATFRGPGGFTQIPMVEDQARACAEALGVEFEIHGIVSL